VLVDVHEALGPFFTFLEYSALSPLASMISARSQTPWLAPPDCDLRLCPKFLTESALGSFVVPGQELF
jgi:hypothetical protein